MHKLTWYRQHRYDGATRTAIDVDGNTLFHSFENESDEPDPALLWYVDLRCEGARLPTSPPEVRGWLLGQGGVFREALAALAEELRAGIDADAWPLLRKVTGLPGRARATLACSASRRLEGLGLANVLAQIAAHWEEGLRSLPAVEPSRAG